MWATMTLLTLIITLVVVGVLLWALQQFPAIDPTIKRIIYVVVIVAVVLWVAASILGHGDRGFNPRLW